MEHFMFSGIEFRNKFSANNHPKFSVFNYGIPCFMSKDFLSFS